MKTVEEMEYSARAKVRNWLATDKEDRAWKEEKRGLFWRSQECWFGIMVGMGGGAYAPSS